MRDEETGELLPDVQLAWGNDHVATDAQGAYSFGDTAYDGLPVCARLVGYVDSCSPVAPGGDPGISLRPIAVEMTFFDPRSYDPLQGVVASTSGADAHSNEDGRLILRRLQQGAVINVRRRGYQVQEHVFQGEERITLALRPRVIDGVAWDGYGDLPVEGALVAWHEDDAQDRQVITDSEGRYQLVGVDAPATLTISAMGYLSYTQAISLELPSVLTHTLEPFIVRGVYASFGVLYLPERLAQIIDLVERTELNAIVMDVKSDRGRIAHRSQVEIAQEGNAFHPDMADLRELVRKCREKGIYTIARMVTFKDPVLSSTRPEYAIRRDDGSLYVDLEGLTWADPFRQEVRDYNIALAVEIAEIGFDEIQLDYLRFPSDGVTRNIVYPVTNTVESRSQAIGEFCAQVREAVRPMGVAVSADVFGLVVSVKGGRDLGIGQRLEDIAPNVDYISAMLYPSTFGKGNLGLDNPSQEPYQVVYKSCIAALGRTKTKMRPWLQYYWGDADYYRAQKQAAIDAKTYGWMFWNAGGKYTDEAAFEPAPEGGELPAGP